MAEPIGAGDWIVSLVTGSGFTKDSVYLCTEIFTESGIYCNACHKYTPKCFGVGIKDMPSRNDRGLWAGCRFRPLPRSSHIEQLLTTLKTPAKEKQYERV